MPTTVESLARDVVASVKLSTQWVLAARWVSLRYQEIGSEGQRRFRHLRRVLEATIPATVEAGLATTTQHSRVVTGDATAQAAWTAITPPPTADALWAFRVGTPWYAVVALEQGHLTLASPMAEAGVTAAAYKLVARFVPLDPAVRQVKTVAHPAKYRFLDLMAMEDLEMNSPTRNLVDSFPEVYAEANVLADGTKTIEPYPYIGTTAELLRYLAYIHPPELLIGDLIPPTIDPIKLREGVLIDAMRWKMAEALELGKVDVAAVWRNEYRAQETRWKDIKGDAAQMDVGVDDASLLLDPMIGPPPRRMYDIRTAEDQIWSRYP